MSHSNPKRGRHGTTKRRTSSIIREPTHPAAATLPMGRGSASPRPVSEPRGYNREVTRAAPMELLGPLVASTAEPNTVAESAPLIVANRYALVERIGKDHGAERFIADQILPNGLQRRVALDRVLKKQPLYDEAREILHREAHALIHLHHPGIVGFIDLLEDEDASYLVREHVDGGDLGYIVSTLRERKKGFSFPLAVFIVREILWALDHAHNARDRRGVPLDLVHRGIAPHNLFVTRQGHMKLDDFGLARLSMAEVPETEPGLVKGHYNYLAPEYIAGEPCSPRSDIYAAGVVLYELLSGWPCFEAEHAYGILWKIVHEGPSMKRLERESVPEALQRIVARATDVLPERRYTRASDMARDLESWLGSGRHRAEPWMLATFIERHGLWPSPGTATIP